MFASIGEPTSHVISKLTSSEYETYRPDTYEQGIVEEGEEETDYETDKQIEASGLTKTDPNNQGSCFADRSSTRFHHQRSCHLNGLVKRLELLILETKAGHDRLYDEMLDISKQLLSMNIINQEQLDNFLFNCAK